jgi:hypothetical protein
MRTVVPGCTQPIEDRCFPTLAAQVWGTRLFTLARKIGHPARFQFNGSTYKRYFEKIEAIR